MNIVACTVNVSVYTIGGPIQCVVSYRDQCAHKHTNMSLIDIILITILYYSNVNVLRNDNNVARVKSKRIETSICSIINIKLSKPIFGLPMCIQSNFTYVNYKF